MDQEPGKTGKILLYNNGGEKEFVSVIFQDETFWLTQKAMAELFDVKTPAISKHLQNIYEEEELDRGATISKMKTVQDEGGRSVRRTIDFYNPTMGLTAWKGAPDGKILKSDVLIAKNYLNEKELSRLNRLVTMFIDYAEAVRITKEFSEKYNLHVEPDAKVMDIPVGMKQKVEILKALVRGAKILILDEPTAGLDPEGVESILGNIREYHQAHNATVILVSHSMEEVARSVDRLVAVNDGTIPFQGAPREVFRHGAELEQMGLGVPQLTRVFHRLNAMGVDIDPSVYTLEQAKEAVLAVLGRTSSDKGKGVG